MHGSGLFHSGPLRLNRLEISGKNEMHRETRNTLIMAVPLLVVSSALAYEMIIHESLREDLLFDAKVQSWEENAARSPILLKEDGLFYFFHREDYEAPAITNGEITGGKPDSERKRFFTIRYVDGWIVHQCEYAFWDLSESQRPTTETLDADECSQRIIDDHIFGPYGA